MLGLPIFVSIGYTAQNAGETIIPNRCSLLIERKIKQSIF